MRKTLVCFMLTAFLLATASYASDRAPTEKAEYGYTITEKNSFQVFPSQEVPSFETTYLVIGKLDYTGTVHAEPPNIMCSHYAYKTKLLGEKKTKPFRSTIRYLRKSNSYSFV